MRLSTKQIGVSISIGLNCFLILLKLSVGLSTGSIGVIASAIDSAIDLFASIVAFFAVFIADTPPDEDHPFGHGKFEDFSGLIEAALIVVGAIVIIWQAISKLNNPQHAMIEPLGGIIVMVIALILDFAVSRIVFRIAEKTDSSALHANAHHLNTDVFGSLAVLIGLGLVKLTGNPIFDPLMALIIAVLIIRTGIQIIHKVFNHLVDTALPVEEADKILALIEETMPIGEPYTVEGLKTRRSGSYRLIAFNLRVSPDLTVQRAHDYCDQIEEAVEKMFPSAQIDIHIEPLVAARAPSTV